MITWVVVFIISAALAIGTTSVDLPWTCSKVPSGCIPYSSARTDECQADSDCHSGAQCCYKGCNRKCEFPNPCAHVVCKNGYLCRAREKPCRKPPCQLQATCLPETEVRCATPECSTEKCQPGYERGKNADGCPSCQCVMKPDCRPSCHIFCPYGYNGEESGCPSCMCKPEPPNPCSNMSCGQDKECRFVQVVCKKAPCEPIPMCVAKTLVLFENSCSLADPTTVGLPVLESSTSSELDCYLHPCPDRTVCSVMGRDISRCCWQASQEQVLPPPKAGECPKETVNLTATSVNCVTDEDCPDQKKCCITTLPTDSASRPSSKQCMNPVQNFKKIFTSECHRFSFVRFFFSWFWYC